MSSRSISDGWQADCIWSKGLLARLVIVDLVLLDAAMAPLWGLTFEPGDDANAVFQRKKQRDFRAYGRLLLVARASLETKLELLFDFGE